MATRVLHNSSIVVNVDWLNRTANKWPRGTNPMPSFVVWHETASPNPDNSAGTLNFNLPAAIQSSYHYLIGRDGTIYWYIDEQAWIAYHAGLHSAARGYIEWGVNVNSIGIELDGRNDGTPITPAQRDAAVKLLLYFRDEYRIPLQRAYHIAHKEAAPGYKIDPKGYSVDTLLQIANQSAGPPPPPSPIPMTNPQVLALPRLETTEGHWLRSLERQNAADRGLPLAAQQWLYRQLERNGVEGWLILGMMNKESQFGHTGAGPEGNNWLNIREFSPNRPRVIINGRGFERYGNPEFSIERGILYLASTYNYLFQLKTLREVVERWAPRQDGNNPDAYIKSILEDRAYILSH